MNGHVPYIRNVPGSDTAVLCVHGILGTPRHFDFLLEAVPERWSIRNLLLAGHGGTVQEFSKASMAVWSRQVQEALQELSAAHSRVILLGHSMGALLALEAAIRHPEQVQQLMLLAAPLALAPRLSFLLKASSVGMGTASAEDPLVGAMTAAYSLQPERCVWRYIGWLPRYLELFGRIRAVRRELPRLKTPCLAFQSAHDALVSPRAGKLLAALPCARVAVLEDSDHYGYSEGDRRILLDAMAALQ